MKTLKVPRPKTSKAQFEQLRAAGYTVKLVVDGHRDFHKFSTELVEWTPGQELDRLYDKAVMQQSNAPVKY